jgi:hypothetical protein
MLVTLAADAVALATRGVDQGVVDVFEGLSRNTKAETAAME